MSKRTVFTTITPLPAGVSRETVMSTLRDHLEMIDLNPLVIERSACKPPSYATPEEYHAVWYSITDRVSYLPGGLAQGKVTYQGCFNDLAEGLQTHVYAPMGLDIRSRWILGGNLPGEPAVPVELGLNIPRQGLYLREDVNMKCNMLMVSFVKKTLKKSHASLVNRLVEKAKIVEADRSNAILNQTYDTQAAASSTASPSLYNASPVSSHPSLAHDQASLSHGSHEGSTTLPNQGSSDQFLQYSTPNQSAPIELGDTSTGKKQSAVELPGELS